VNIRRVVVATAVTVGVSGALILTTLPAADAAVHLESKCSKTSGVTCYYAYDKKAIPGATGKIDLGVNIRMSKGKKSYCPTAYVGRNNLTSRTETAKRAWIVWTDTKKKQHKTAKTTWGDLWLAHVKGDAKGVTTPWWNWVKQTCGLWVPVGQSGQYYKKGNGLFIEMRNTKGTHTVRVDTH
jgi:hypothetical protein